MHTAEETAYYRALEEKCAEALRGQHEAQEREEAMAINLEEVQNGNVVPMSDYLALDKKNKDIEDRMRVIKKD